MQVSNDPFSFQQAVQKVDEKNFPLHLSKNPFKAKIREWINALNHNVVIQLSVYYSANVHDISNKPKFFPDFLWIFHFREGGRRMWNPSGRGHPPAYGRPTCHPLD
jgi:hypothetical protein